MELVILLSTISSDKAEELANSLVLSKLAACVNITKGIKSIYYWDDKLCKDEESLLFIKALMKNKEKCIEFIQEHHPYDTPEIVALKVDDVNTPYLQWVADITL